MQAYASYGEWRRDQSPRNQRLISTLAKLLAATAPDLTATVKWGQGCWTLDGSPRVYMHAEPDHIQFGFFAGATLDDPERLLVGKGKHVRHVKVFRPGDIQTDALTALIRQVV